MKKNLLMIFIKNPQLGTVKTRLAATIGEENALKIYHHLLSHTHRISSPLQCHKAVFYSSFIDRDDRWGNDHYEKFLQTGDDLGERMYNAFDKGFILGYRHIVVIGSDCLELEQRHITAAFKHLEDHDVVIGPSKDGGYYLLGMKMLHPEIFTNKRWSTESVFQTTIEDLDRLVLKTCTLPILSDVDTENDVGELSTLIEHC